MPPADCNHQTKRRLLQQEGGLSPGAPVGEVFPWESCPLCLSRALTNGVQAIIVFLTQQTVGCCFELQKVFAGQFYMVKITDDKH